jgi:hypothetical protein
MTRSTRGTYTYMHTLPPPITIRRRRLPRSRRPFPMEPSCGSSSISCRLRVHTHIRRSTYCMHQQFGLVSGGWGPVEQLNSRARSQERRVEKLGAPEISPPISAGPSPPPPPVGIICLHSCSGPWAPPGGYAPKTEPASATATAGSTLSLYLYLTSMRHYCFICTS